MAAPFAAAAAPPAESVPIDPDDLADVDLIKISESPIISPESANRSRSRIFTPYRPPPTSSSVRRAPVPAPVEAKASSPQASASLDDTLDYSQGGETTLDYEKPETTILSPLTPLPDLSQASGAANGGPSPTTSELDRSRTRDYGPATDPREHHEHVGRNIREETLKLRPPASPIAARPSSQKRDASASPPDDRQDGARQRTSTTGGASSSSAPAAIPEAIPVLPLVEPSDNDETIDYGPATSEKVNEDKQEKLELHSYQVWFGADHAEHRLARPLRNVAPVGFKPHFDEEYFMHAIADAEQVLHFSQQAERGELPWTEEEAFAVLRGPVSRPMCFFYDIRDDQCFSVSSDDNLTPQEVIDNWDVVEAGDYEEAVSLYSHDVFELDKSVNATNVVDGIWVRKWKNREKRIVKSRCCGRGFLDRQKTTVSRHSSTASRLSHRLLCSLAMQFELTLESFDISTAFLQGLKFSEVVAKAKELGHEVKEARQVWFRPPANIWRHWRNIPQSKIMVLDGDISIFILKCLKALYGLVDAPLLWQLALLHYLKLDIGYRMSTHDECFLMIIDGWQVISLCIIHVDDLLLAATRKLLDFIAMKLGQKFGKPKRTSLPFLYLGMKHEMLSPGHLLVHQQHYLEKLPEGKFTNAVNMKKDFQELDEYEHHQFRSLVCSLLWLCLTRIDIAHDVVALQSEMICPQVQHLKMANKVLIRARKTKEYNGLHYHQMRFPIKLCSIHDCGHASKKSCYPYEGKFVMMMHDSLKSDAPEWLSGQDLAHVGGYAHTLFYSARKASRVSHSTSHAETLSAVGCTQMGQLIAARVTEMFCRMVLPPRASITAHDMLSLSEKDITVIAHDSMTDCMDLFELITGGRGVPSDKSQRVAIMALREDRVHHRIRSVLHVPTRTMLADGLTKEGWYDQLLTYCTTGKIKMVLLPDQAVRHKRASLHPEATEKEIENLDE